MTVSVATLATREPYLSMAAAIRFELAKVDIPVMVHTCGMGEHPWQVKRHAVRSAFERYGGTAYWLDADCVVRDLEVLRGLLIPRVTGVHVLSRFLRIGSPGRRMACLAFRDSLQALGLPRDVGLLYPCDWFWSVSFTSAEADKFFAAWNVVADCLRRRGVNWGDAISVALAAVGARVPMHGSMLEADFDRAVDHKRLGPLDANFQALFPKGSP